jgi:hypothetical protein
MKNLEEYINKRIKETNKNLKVLKDKINDSYRVSDPLWVKAHTNMYLDYHGLLGGLAIFNEIKSKLNEDGKHKNK